MQIKCVFVCFLLIVNGDLRSVVKSFFYFHLTVNSSLRATSSENQQCGFRTDSTQNELYSHRSRLETGNLDLESRGIVLSVKRKQRD